MRNLFNGDKGTHGFQTMAAFSPNGMIAMSDTFYGRSHDSTLMHERILRVAAVFFRLRLTVFGDAAFGSPEVVQCMVKNVNLADDRSFNTLMSRIRIHIENAFAGQSNQFRFSAFSRR